MVQNIAIERDLFFARPLPNNDGYTWTLASRLGHILRRAEELYGPRDHTYTLIGVEIEADGPKIWYPGNCCHVVIQISPECAKDFVRTCYELAHECIHLLAPSGGPGANVLEGVATFFSSLYVKETFAVDFHPVLESYRLAGELVEKSLASEPDAIRSIRQRQPAFSKVTWTTF